MLVKSVKSIEHLALKKVLLWNAAFWGTLWLFSVWNNYQWSQSAGSLFTWNIVFSWSFPHYMVMVLVGPIIFKLYKTWKSKSYLRQAAYHALPAVVNGLTHQLLLNIFYIWLKPVVPGDQTTLLEGVLERYAIGFNFSINGFLFYWLCLGLVFGADIYLRYQHQQISNLELKSALEQAKMQALKSQLQPHFLFNTFNSISMMARKGQQQAVVNMVSHLSKLLRETLRLGEKSQLSLKEELELTQHYINIEQTRFRDRLTVKMDLQAGVEQHIVPVLLLQPLVENAFVHGIAKVEGPSFLEIKAFTRGDRLIIIIIHSAPPLPEHWVWEDNLGIGLSNVLKRLDALYGNNYRFELSQLEEQQGICTEIQLPFD